jgi:hypothetical protein
VGFLSVYDDEHPKYGSSDVMGKQKTITLLRELKDKYACKLILTTGDASEHVNQVIDLIATYEGGEDLIDDICNWEGYNIINKKQDPAKALTRKNDESGKNEMFEHLISKFNSSKSNIFIFYDGPTVAEKARAFMGAEYQDN